MDLNFAETNLRSYWLNSPTHTCSKKSEYSHRLPAKGDIGWNFSRSFAVQCGFALVQKVHVNLSQW